jgi:hypothetical protein
VNVGRILSLCHSGEYSQLIIIARCKDPIAVLFGEAGRQRIYSPGETACFRVVDHYAKELQVAVAVTLDSVRKETGRRLRVYQF